MSSATCTGASAMLVGATAAAAGTHLSFSALRIWTPVLQNTDKECVYACACVSVRLVCMRLTMYAALRVNIQQWKDVVWGRRITFVQLMENFLICL